jgi:hypothetical protein
VTENKALILNFVVGCLVTWGSVILLDALGAAGRIQGVVAILGIVVFSFLIGVIGTHYRDKAVAEGKDPDERF